MEGRHKTEDDAGENGDSEIEEKNAEIGSAGNVHAAGIGRQINLHERAVGPECDSQACETTKRGERKALNQELSDDARARSTHGQTNGDFLDAAGTANEHEVGKVGASDEQDDAGGGHQDPKRSGKLAARVRTALGAGQNVDPTFEKFVAVVF